MYRYGKRRRGGGRFAFNVDTENFTKPRRRYKELDLEYTFQDHTCYHSIYTWDPVELTTLVVDPTSFFGQK